MSVARKNIEACIGCGECAKRCPMDVFYLDATEGHSVIAYPENCQSCAQCYLGCPTDALMMIDLSWEYSPVPARGLKTFTGIIPPKEEEGERKAS